MTNMSDEEKDGVTSAFLSGVICTLAFEFMVILIGFILGVVKITMG